MLLGLSIRDIVLIERLELRFRGGLCVLTGETGAGKSILLDALSLALGGRGDAQLVRHGAAQGAVAATFETGRDHPAREILVEQGLDWPADEPLVLRRVLQADGRSRAFVNDQPASVALLRRLGQTLVELHGQGAEQGLLDPAQHRVLLDAFGGLGDDLAELRRRHEARRAAREAVMDAERALAEARRDEDYLRFVLAELDRLAPEAGEEAKLADERAFLMQTEKLAQAFHDATQHLNEGGAVQSRIGAARRAVERVAERAGERVAALLAAFERTEAELAELLASLDETSRLLDLDPARLEKVEERLFALRAAARKHGCGVDELPARREDFARRLSAIETGDADLGRLGGARAAAEAAYAEAANALGAARRKAAARLDRLVGAELEPLRLGAARFRTEIAPLPPEEAGPDGTERVVFQVATNAGAPFAPLAKIASGGELSRFMLALRVVLARQGRAGTLVFDEVDHGIGGATADAVGERLTRLAAERQVLVVTHSPQVAARGGHHFRIAKSAAGNGRRAATSVSVEELSQAARREEIARMLAGATVTDEARAAALSLIEGRGA
ncbi:MAG: DNA repair protein RecN [Alphaproteobacteria bacterium]|nr:DNA repair protein RecN [Alphaproteobacteria bacterium]